MLPTARLCAQVLVIMWDPDEPGAPPPGCSHAGTRRHAARPQLLQPGRLLLQEEGVLGETHHRVSGIEVTQCRWRCEKVPIHR